MKKATGIVRKLDELGRYVVPKELRRTLGINEGDSVEAFVNGDEIILKKYQPGCVICGSMEDIKLVKDKRLCSSCANEALVG